ncbi:MAG: hypothetical protein K0S53_2243 [Bacteroidetes bacterium]|jgi:hypothetical protein|nr:hypothetical protein [Bacteroidota bacterium]MDF2452010.1 hypothetical protein [Bacteroidota bacterium]
MNYTDLISTIGVSLILLAFFLNTFKYIADNGKLYFVMNITGGAFACYGSILLGSVPFIILEGTWSIVALVGLIKNLKQ